MLADPDHDAPSSAPSTPVTRLKPMPEVPVPVKLAVDHLTASNVTWEHTTNAKMPWEHITVDKIWWDHFTVGKMPWNCGPPVPPPDLNLFLDNNPCNYMATAATAKDSPPCAAGTQTINHRANR